MTDLPKGLFILVVAGAIGYQSMSLLDIDYLAQTPASAKINSNKASLMDAEKLEAIAQGADPTDLFEPTAAGKPINLACDSGYIEGDINENRFSKIGYASITERGITYIQVSRYSPSYLVQEQYQSVTATEVEKLPDSIKAQLQKKISNPAGCSSQNLYLSQIKYLR